MANQNRHLATLCLFLAFSASMANAEDWWGWRGPTSDGVAGKQAKPPIRWDAQTNLAWAADLPGEGSATPIVVGDRIFVLSAEKTDRKSESKVTNDERAKTVPDEFFYRFLVVCLDRTNGKLLWQKSAIEEVPHEGRHETNTYASGSPTSDGERLYVSFGSRGLFCYSLQGDLLWQIDLGNMRTRYGWGEAVTPVLSKELLIVNWDQEEGSFLIGLDKWTGKTRWKTDRSHEVTSWNTPLVTTVEGKELIVVNGTGTAKAYDARNGEVLWECGGQTTNAIPSPVRYGDSVICMSGYRGSCACAIPLLSRGDITGTDKVTWHIGQGTPYVPSPIVVGQRLLFTAGNSDVLSCVDVRTGQSLMDRKRLSGVKTLYASPIAANGYLYYLGREGTTVVLRDDASLETMAVNQLEGTFDASPVAVDHQLLLRSWNKLYCLEEKGVIADQRKIGASSELRGTRLRFEEVKLESTDETSANVSLCDLDGDKDLDIVLAKGRHWPLANRVLLNDGTARFERALDVGEKPDRSYSALTGDLDGDGDSDLVVSNDRPDRKQIFLNDGKAQFVWSGVWGEPEWNTRNAALADLNGDLRLDIVAANRKSPSYICLNDGNGSFPKELQRMIPFDSAASVAIADLNGDHLPDLLLPHRDGGQSQIFFNDPEWTFRSAANFGPVSCSSRAIHASDLNGDGAVDIVLGDDRLGTIVCWNDGKGRLPTSTFLGDAPLIPYACAIGDMNGDKHPDVVVGYSEGAGSIFLNDGTGTRFEQDRFGDGKGAAYGMALGDLDGDGRLDIAVARSGASNVIYLQRSEAHR